FEHGRFVLRGELDESTRTRLLAERQQRPQPLRDDKVVASWNGLAVAALAEAGWGLEGAGPLETARAPGAGPAAPPLHPGCGEFLLGPLSTPEGRLFRTWRAGDARNAGVLDDYADVAHGLYELHLATGELRWLEESRRLALLAVELFGDDERGGFFMTAADGE